MPTDSIEGRYTLRDVARVAARGAKWLDRHCPGWAQATNPETLQMVSGARCIMGQNAQRLTGGRVRSGTSGSYASALQALGYEPWDQSLGSWAVRHGFLLARIGIWDGSRGNGEVVTSQLTALTEAWRQEIAIRRGSAS